MSAVSAQTPCPRRHPNVPFEPSNQRAARYFDAKQARFSTASNKLERAHRLSSLGGAQLLSADKNGCLGVENTMLVRLKK